MKWLEKAYLQRDDFLLILKNEPRFDGLRSDRRFLRLERRTGWSLSGKPGLEPRQALPLKKRAQEEWPTIRPQPLRDAHDGAKAVYGATF